MNAHDQQSPGEKTASNVTIQLVIQKLKYSWKTLALTDVVFKMIAAILLVPMTSLLFRCFLGFSGRTVLADTDIVNFALHPLGWVTITVIGGATTAILAMEQSVLMTICRAAEIQKPLTTLSAFRFVCSKSLGIFQLTLRGVASLIVLAAPFLIVGGGLFLMLLTDHDINFYLTEKPPKFWVAVTLIGAVLLTMMVFLMLRISNWLIALQLFLFEKVSSADCLRISQDRIQKHRWEIAKWIVVWGALNTLLSTLASGVVFGAGKWIVPASTGSLWLMVITLGVVMTTWFLVNLLTSLLAVISFAILLESIYSQFAGVENPSFIPEVNKTLPSLSPSWTTGRILSALILSLVTAIFIGVMTIDSIQLNDDVEITAHRGSSGNAPENTLAAIHLAIENQTDWVEIDVQESKDGVVVVAHDSDLKKVSGVDTKIWEATSEELRRIDIGSYFAPEFKNERVPTLAEVLEVCRGKVGLNIELKYYGHDQNLEQKVVDLVEAYEMESHVVIMSLKLKGVQKVQKLRPDWTVGLLTAVVAGDLTRTDVDFLAVSTKIATRSFIQSAHIKGKRVHVWTVNDPITMSKLISRGTDNLITDYPGIARQLLNERREMNPVERLLVELSGMFGVSPAISIDP